MQRLFLSLFLLSVYKIYKLNYVLGFGFLFIFSIFIQAQVKAENLKTLEQQTHKSISQWTETLKTERKHINSDNFPQFIEKYICQPLELLSLNNLNIPSEKESLFLKEVVKTYGSVLNYTEDSNYYYCLYHYFDSTGFKPRESTLQVLSQVKRKRLIEKLKMAKRVTLEGNGDEETAHLSKPDLSNSAVANLNFENNKETINLSEQALQNNSIDFNLENNKKLMSLSDLLLPNYKQISVEDKKQYSRHIRSAWLEFENQIQSSQKAKPNQTETFNILDKIFTPAIAKTNELCLIGGVLRPQTLSNGRYLCSTFGNPCQNGRSDTFKCGKIFNEKCVKRQPVKSLSQRCFKAAKNDPVDEQKYNEYIAQFHNIYRNYCSERVSSGRNLGHACDVYFDRIRSINLTYSGQFDGGGLQFQKELERIPCDDCDKKFSFSIPQRNISIFNQFSGTMKIMDFLSNTVYQNSRCFCGGNNRCTRGCGVNYNRQAVKVIDCAGNKSRKRSTDKCMRYVTAAIMNTVHLYFGKHCSNRNEISYNMCLRQERQRNSHNAISLCNRSLMLPSALCGLNLDKWKPRDKSRYHLIRSNYIKRNCEAHYRSGNRFLTSVYITRGDRKVKVPLFQEISIPKNLEKLPTGAIIVSKSNNPHGHIEIKTNKKECEGSTCFCSDFCVSRKNGYEYPFKPLVAFRWNPEVIEYYESL